VTHVTEHRPTNVGMMFTVKHCKTAAGHVGVGATRYPEYTSLVDLVHIWRLRTCKVVLRKIDRSKKGTQKFCQEKRERVKR